VSFDFTGKRVLATGGTRGIGRAAVEAFLAAGARVAVNGRSEESTHNAVARLGPNAIAAPGDIARPDACRAMVSHAARRMDGLDVLVNCAGVAHGGPVDEVTEAVWDQTMDANLKGTFFCTQAVVPHLRQSKGNAVFVASDAGLIGEAGLAIYCASKGGVVNLTRALALELAPEVRVNCVCPGYVDTDMVRRDVIEASNDPAGTERKLAAAAPLQRIGKPAEIATSILYLASPSAKFITGSALQIDGGTTAGHPRAE
jgi:NAD(P)-dependent dehydrogenase (short-subunit alcohol dehydrogenase family)